MSRIAEALKKAEKERGPIPVQEHMSVPITEEVLRPPPELAPDGVELRDAEVTVSSLVRTPKLAEEATDEKTENLELAISRIEMQYGKGSIVTALPATPGAVLVLGRFVRVGIALALLALSCWVLLPFGVVPVSTVAVTNARLAHVRTMVTGQILRLHVEVGDRVDTGQALLEIAGSSPGAAEDLLKKKSDAEIQATALNAQIAETEKRLRDYDKQVQEDTRRTIGAAEMRLRQESVDLAKATAQRLTSTSTSNNEALAELDREIGRLETTLIGLRARYSDSYPDIQRITRQLAAAQHERAALAPTGVAPEAAGGSEEQAAGTNEVETRSAAVERLTTQLSNLQANNLVAPDMDGLPSKSERDEAAGDLSHLREQKLVVELQQRVLSDQLAQLTRSSGEVAVIKSSADGVVWSRDVPPGQTVREGDELVRIAETNSIHVEAYVDSRYAQRLSIGDRALVNLTSVNKRLSGRIALIEAPGQLKAGADDYAIDLKAPTEANYRVVVQLDPADRESVQVGQVAKVLFPGPDSSLTAHVYSWLNRF
jgi:multidrug resistance efflux pump